MKEDVAMSGDERSGIVVSESTPSAPLGVGTGMPVTDEIDDEQLEYVVGGLKRPWIEPYPPGAEGFGSLTGER